MKLMKTIKRFVKDERGLETVEYAIILGLIVAATISLIVLLGNWVKNQFQNITSTVVA
jgi:Flp pilus assembly pilin Flp